MLSQFSYFSNQHVLETQGSFHLVAKTNITLRQMLVAVTLHTNTDKLVDILRSKQHLYLTQFLIVTIPTMKKHSCLGLAR